MRPSAEVGQHSTGVDLKQAGRAGRKPKLSAGQLRKIEQALRRGPEALGYASGLWTAGRVRKLIEHQCGVRYHEAHVWRILRQLGWSWPATHRAGAGARREGDPVLEASALATA
jgi:transposase